MATWRMAFRDGSRGPTLWPECLRLGVAAIAYKPLESIDLSKYPECQPKSLWTKLAPTQKASLRRIAYEMKPGDMIYVKEGPKIVCRGLVTGPYQYDSMSRIVAQHGLAWRHQVPVDWETDFPEVSVLLGAEQLTVKPLTQADIQRIGAPVDSPARTLQMYFARLCWNTHEWICPSGDARNLEKSNTYASRMGFGHEEWLFNFRWLVGGWKYSFLQPINKSIKHVSGTTIDVRLFTVGSERRWLYVGEIRECQVLTHEQARYARDEFMRRGWLCDMEKHVRAVGGDVRGLHGDDPRNLFNIRFRREDAELYDPLVRVDDSDAIRKITRYSLVPGHSMPRARHEWATRVAATKERPTGKVHRRAVAAGVMELEHNRMQDELTVQLREKYGKEAVTVEEGFVDIKLRDGKRIVFLEVKSDSRARRAIREALGQLLEYEFIAAHDGDPPTELVVAAPGPLLQRDSDYLCHLGERWSLPIRYVCISPEKTTPEI